MDAASLSFAARSLDFVRDDKKTGDLAFGMTGAWRFNVRNETRKAHLALGMTRGGAIRTLCTPLVCRYDAWAVLLVGIAMCLSRRRLA